MSCVGCDLCVIQDYHTHTYVHCSVSDCKVAANEASCGLRGVLLPSASYPMLEFTRTLIRHCAMQYSQLQLHHSVCIRVLYNYEDVVLVRCYHYFVLLAAQAQKGERICLIQSSHDAICLHISNMETVDSQFTRMALARRARDVTNRQVALNQNGKPC
eukprot:9378-Heterococcus_DN1.PRE.2